MFHCAVLLNMVKLGVQKNYPDETWSMNQLVGTLCNRRYTERTVAYAQSHDQSIVGAQRPLLSSHNHLLPLTRVCSVSWTH